MTSDRESQLRPRRRSLRTRIVATFAGLAVVPFVASMVILFHVARHDVIHLQGSSLAQGAQLLAERVRIEAAQAQTWLAGFASLPEVRAYMGGSASYPDETLSTARRLVQGLRDVQFHRQPSGATADPVPPDSPGIIRYRVPTTSLDGRSLGTVEASFDLEPVRRLIDRFRRGEEGVSILFTSQGRVLATPSGLPPPPLDALTSEAAWTRIDWSGRTYYASVAPIEAAGDGAGGDWRVAVLQPKPEFLAPFYSVTRHVGVLLAGFAIIVIALAWRLANRFLTPILQMRHGAEIMSRTNLAHRIEVDTGDELEELAHEFNRMAETLGGAYEELEQRVRETTRSLQEERNRLATVLRTMAEGVIVANESGEVILMNPRARIAVDTGPSSGIGSHLSRVLPGDRLEFHLKRLRKNWDEGREAVEDVVFPVKGGNLLKGSVSVVPGPSGERAGFLLVFRDMDAEAEEERQVQEALREMPELLKGPVGTARSLVEALKRHPDMPGGKRDAFLAAVTEEIDRLTARLDVAEKAAAAAADARWPGVPSDPKELVEEAVASVPGVYARIEMPEGPVPPVMVEPFSWTSALSCVLRWIAEQSSGWVPVVATLRVEEDTVITAFRVEGEFERDPAEIESLEVAPPGEEVFSLEEAVHLNRGVLWTRGDEGTFEVRLGLVRASTAPSEVREKGIADQQPEFYNFDLFLPRPAQELRETLKAPLTGLEYVVFDTETTGLHPSKGDQVVSLSAVRIRRGKLQSADTFHTLVDPGCPIPPESTRFHGIRDDMVAGAPTMGEVLTKFYEFVGERVLVAHNAAFDKKFLDLAADREEQPRLENPILDTLFLSYGIHKDFEGHNIEAIARRLGIEVEGRHTSLGDARTTAEIFLRLVPLLSSRGVVTLADAKAFCDRMLLLRWQSSRF